MLQIRKNTIDICILILYPATLPIIFAITIAGNCLVYSLGFYVDYHILHLHIVCKDSFVFTFLLFIPLIALSRLITSTILNRVVGGSLSLAQLVEHMTYNFSSDHGPSVVDQVLCQTPH